MFTLSRFLGMQRNPHTPFIIGIAGSVAVGKSTTARLLQLLFSWAYPDKRVQEITTDGFFISRTRNLNAAGFWIARVFRKAMTWNCSFIL